MAVKPAALLLAVSLVGVGALAILAAAPGPLQSDIVYVSKDGFCGGNTPCVATIAEALRNVTSGGLIFVYNGTYDERVSIDIPVTITGESRDVVTVGGAWEGARVQVGNSGVTLQELTLESADRGVESFASGLAMDGLRITDVYGGVLAMNSDGLRMNDSSVEGAQAYAGVEIVDSDDLKLLGNSITGGADRGVYIVNATGVEVSWNTITGNAFEGLNITAAVNVTVANNTVEDNGFSPFFAGVGPGPTQGGGPGGGLWFWEVDPTAVEYNVVRNNVGTGILIGGLEKGGRVQTRDFTLNRNTVERNTDGIFVVFAQNVRIENSEIRGNSAVGIAGQQSSEIHVLNNLISGNGMIIPFVTRSGDEPRPLQGGGGGLWFWEVDPSEIAGNLIVDNEGPGVTLVDTLDFNVTDNTIANNLGPGVLFQNVTRSAVLRNAIRNNTDVGADVEGSNFVDIDANAFEDLDVGILVNGGCDIRIGRNTFTNVGTPIQIQGNPCNLTQPGIVNATLRFMPSTLNLKSQGQYVTLRFELEGVALAEFDANSLSFDVNGVLLTPPAGTPSTVVEAGGFLRVMVKLDRAEAIAAFGTSGTYTVTVSGTLTNGMTWSASDTVEAILP